MNSDASLTTSFWLMVVVQTIGSVDLPGRGERKMPSPAHYVAIVVTWLVLFVIATWSEGLRRAATAGGWLMVITGMVIGPFGAAFINFLRTISKNFAVSPPKGEPQFPTGP